MSISDWVLCFFYAVLGCAVLSFDRASAEPTANSPFLHQVKQHFVAWDLDEDGELSKNEIELAVHNPDVRGEAAACAAALRRGVRGIRGLAPLSLEEISETLKPDRSDDKPQPNFERKYAWALEKITTARKELFAEGSPHIEAISQGKLGDCFLLVSLGTCAHCDPDRLKRMMQPAGNGKVRITLGSGRTMELDAPTDAELAIGATTRNTGCWASMYEKAIGTVMIEKSTRYVTPLDRIGIGGTPHIPLEILTGHDVRRHGCELYREPVDENGASLADLAPLREDLKAAFAEGRLVVGGCGPKGKQTLVSGIYYNHSYGVLDYDEESDTVLFWNPFGHKRTPQGPEGLKYGYTTSHGKFRVPLAEAVMWFGSFSIETTEPAE